MVCQILQTLHNLLYCQVHTNHWNTSVVLAAKSETLTKASIRRNNAGDPRTLKAGFFHEKVTHTKGMCNLQASHS